jgi:hypothetical protein
MDTKKCRTRVRKGTRNCGLNFAYGKFGFSEDYFFAHMWLSLATLQGDEEAESLLYELEEVMVFNDVAKARQHAREWKERHGR